MSQRASEPALQPSNGNRQNNRAVVVTKVERKPTTLRSPTTGNGHRRRGPPEVETTPDSPGPIPRAQQAYPIPPPKPAPPPDARTAAKARKMIQRGRTHYRKGEYDQAEQLLRQAIALHPFFAQANLVLGKIFLIRGSALRDRALVNSARLMFEMARALDPKLREPAVLLELFLEQPPE